MTPTTYKQIMTAMAAYNKKGIPYRRKQVMRLIAILDDIFAHEPYLGDRLHAVGRRQIIGYWERTKHESVQVRTEKYRILSLFFANAPLKAKVPKPRSNPPNNPIK